MVGLRIVAASASPARTLPTCSLPLDEEVSTMLAEKTLEIEELPQGPKLSIR